MKITVVTNEEQKQELLSQGMQQGHEWQWLSQPADIPGTDAYIDLLFSPEPQRIEIWKTCRPATIILHSVVDTLGLLSNEFIRINAWPGFLKRPVMEAASSGSTDKEKVEQVFSCLNKKVEWVPDITGFISPRVISMIINEAYYTLGEGVSTKEEIDTAMKLGTNYPYGPFEWGGMIGLHNILNLLDTLSKENKRYEPAPLLKQEAGTL